MTTVQIDTSFDVRTDSGGRDPDTHSPTLRSYHQYLWSKPLPDGRPFDLVATTPGAYLHHRSTVGEFWLASDSVMQTFTHWEVTKRLVAELPDDYVDWVRTITYTIGGMLIFPGNRVDGKMTINGARGFTRRIADRVDLTLECIRFHYRGEPSPLSAVLARYGDFFDLFTDFEGYVEFFLLEDLMTSDGGVRFFMPFDGFASPSVPRDLETYAELLRRSTDFVEARNRRIAGWVASPARGPGRHIR
ncbi:hypothetical protein ATJ88_1087 [Isoptericola jiangsuensis]|uniref:Uncharacterized protein n=1 Tax=Isoptericola jiangsuensis TaxID=548579 RepID=A0A2A9EW09_9MICO|nr:hypothetical protein [Isoptericola jiangsuensis]PFG42425.1 hypothetical protein ATJ88_1087 [Isoptericola jiangsuensis]